MVALKAEASFLERMNCILLTYACTAVACYKVADFEGKSQLRKLIGIGVIAVVTVITWLLSPIMYFTAVQQEGRWLDVEDYLAVLEAEIGLPYTESRPAQWSLRDFAGTSEKDSV